MVPVTALENTAQLRTLLRQIDLDEAMRRQAVLEAIANAAASTWHRRADLFDWARPRPYDYPGRASRDELAEADERCRLAALACRQRAALVDYEAGRLDE